MNAMILDILARSPREALALDVAIKATLILAAAGFVALALRRSSAAARHLAWCLGLAGALALPVLGLALPGWSWRVLPISAGTDRAPRAKAADSPAPRTAWTTPASSPLDEPALDEDALAVIAPASPLSRPTPANPTASPSDRWWHLTPSWSWLWAAWLAGALAVLSRSLAGWIAVRRLSREARPIDDAGWIALLRELSNELGLTRRILLLRSERGVMPMTWGWTRPVILLPSDADEWDDARRRAVLLHELAHIRRLDCPTQALARLACAVYWFHPLAWLAERRMRVERERACDDVVLLAGARASDYASHLLETARGLRVPRAAALAATAMARSSQLEARLIAILDPARRRVGPGRKPTAIALVTTMIALAPLAMLRVGARAAEPTPPSSDPIADDRPATDPAGRMTVTGRVLDPKGQPVPDAAVMVIVPWKQSDRPALDERIEPTTDHHGRCDGSGRFRIELPRTSSARHGTLILTALAPGHGIGWAELDADADPPEADVSLRPEQVIRGRLFDLKGQPARGVALRVLALMLSDRGDPTRINRPDAYKPPWHDLPGWPAPAISDDEGRFTLRGLGRGLTYPLVVDDPRYALQATLIRMDDGGNARGLAVVASSIQVEPGPEPKPIALALQPARTLVGRVTCGDTGQPVPHALVSIGAIRYQADGEGRFRVAVPATPARPNGYLVVAQSPAGAPYLITSRRVEWPGGAVEQPADIALTRGVTVRGKVTEEGTGRPITGALARFVSTAIAEGIGSSPISVPAATGPDGTFRVAGPPGAGYLVVQGPDDDYVLRELGGERGSMEERPGHERLYAHAYRAVDLKAGGPEREVDLSLRQGRAIHGRAIDPDGRPVRDAWVVSRLILFSSPAGGWKSFRVQPNLGQGRGHVRDGRFALHGLDPGSDAEVAAYFLDGDRKLGATARFSGRPVDGPVTVRLEPCGSARCRLVGPDGKPLAREPAWSLASMVVTPGPRYRRNPAKDDPPFADEVPLFRLDQTNYPPRELRSDAEGRVVFPALIPGATYRIVDQTPTIGGGNPEVRKEFTVKPGEALDLGDILMARPRGRN